MLNATPARVGQSCVTLPRYDWLAYTRALNSFPLVERSRTDRSAVTDREAQLRSEGVFSGTLVMQRDDLIAIYLTLERTQQRPTGIEYNGAERLFYWRFPHTAKSAVDVSLDEPADVMRAIAQLNTYLASRDLPAMSLSTVGWPPSKAINDPE